MADDREPLRFADAAEAEGWYEAHHAKRPDTRARRIEKFISMFERGETLH